MLKKAAAGFTIVELLIATAVFSTVLLVALTGFLQIGRIFYKGISNTQTQDVTRQVINDVSSNLKTASSADAVNGPKTTGSGVYQYVCIGSYRYTYGLHKTGTGPGRPIFYDANTGPDYDPGNSTASFGLLKDKLPGEGTCPAPCVQNGSPSSAAACSAANCAGSCQALDISSPIEMLGSGMRVAKLSLVPISTSVSPADLYTLNVSIAYGDDETIAYDGTGFPYCPGSLSGQKFCAVDQLSTTVYRGSLNP